MRATLSRAIRIALETARTGLASLMLVAVVIVLGVLSYRLFVQDKMQILADAERTIALQKTLILDHERTITMQKTIISHQNWLLERARPELLSLNLELETLRKKCPR